MGELQSLFDLAKAKGHDLPDFAIVNARKDWNEGEKMKCAACSRVWPTSLIDGKDSGHGDFDRLEGPCCFGPGWRPM